MEALEIAVNDPAWSAGYRAFADGLGFLDNPYDSYSDEGRRWIDGYVKSMQDKRHADARALRGREEHTQHEGHMTTLLHHIDELKDDPEEGVRKIVVEHARKNGIDPDHISWGMITFVDDSFLVPVTGGPKRGTLKISIEKPGKLS